MSSNGPFGFDPDDIERLAREAGEGLRDAFDRVGRYIEQSGNTAVFSHVFTGGRRQPETTGESGDGVWAIYTVDADGSARVDQVFAGELDALRVFKDNTDRRRRVRFLPYGVTASVLDEASPAAPDTEVPTDSAPDEPSED
ncbi:hypothetical protein G4X40_21230 [Rhodococcus sp. D2-41]|uniref:Transmembrane protein n=1 Tax=Speluncibacter jeojiensis TaxID=2710754 RepID=A0A9X4M1R1_9ACTN|nr:hypothetical protein [Rhodococcus sp. D2-41]MDG3012668.1 hypothetical protein [Rhodococcus sp. D2-41]MDG3015227.1 hypothetical protein [Corynebacteriales bacterium D3-21]